jgi:hypothetical protein
MHECPPATSAEVTTTKGYRRSLTGYPKGRKGRKDDASLRERQSAIPQPCSIVCVYKGAPLVRGKRVALLDAASTNNYAR